MTLWLNKNHRVYFLILKKRYMMSEEKLKEFLDSKKYEKDKLIKHLQNDFLNIWEYTSIKDDINELNHDISLIYVILWS